MAYAIPGGRIPNVDKNSRKMAAAKPVQKATGWLSDAYRTAMAVNVRITDRQALISVVSTTKMVYAPTITGTTTTTNSTHDKSIKRATLRRTIGGGGDCDDGGDGGSGGGVGGVGVGTAWWNGASLVVTFVYRSGKVRSRYASRSGSTENWRCSPTRMAFARVRHSSGTDGPRRRQYRCVRQRTKQWTWRRNRRRTRGPYEGFEGFRRALSYASARQAALIVRGGSFVGCRDGTNNWDHTIYDLSMAKSGMQTIDLLKLILIVVIIIVYFLHCKNYIN